MFRTNIYLDERQTRALDQAARAQGTTRAALIRRLIDRGLDQVDGDLDSDLAAIEASFGAIAGEDQLDVRAPDERARHLERLLGR
ncbi:MAG: CopG family transcriptional regulator [Solirubrobacteraceae bacterium]